jgi:hypothetical protein
MEESDPRISRAIEQTYTVRPPKQHLATFGVTNVRYYLVSEPSYGELVKTEDESVVREGRVIAERPTIVTPTYMLNLEGFGEDATRYMQLLINRFGPNTPGLLYQYRNEAEGLEIVSGLTSTVAHRIATDLDDRSVDSAAVIMGVDDLWDVSLLQFIYEYTSASLASNVGEIHSLGLLNPDPDVDVPKGVIRRIEELFQQVEQGLDPKLLQQELTRWGLFEHYQDRFLSLFRRR